MRVYHISSSYYYLRFDVIIRLEVSTCLLKGDDLIIYVMYSEYGVHRGFRLNAPPALFIAFPAPQPCRSIPGEPASSQGPQIVHFLRRFWWDDVGELHLSKPQLRERLALPVRIPSHVRVGNDPGYLPDGRAFGRRTPRHAGSVTIG